VAGDGVDWKAVDAARSKLRVPVDYGWSFLINLVSFAWSVSVLALLASTFWAGMKFGADWRK
jgi:hypothetical protein